MTNREVEASGIGWELFKNYLIAKEKFKPDIFLYENNKSAAQSIKNSISQALNVPLIHINSANVSPQNRERFYACNFPTCQPEDRHISMSDVMVSEDYKPYNGGELIRKKPDLLQKCDTMYMIGATNQQCSIGCRVYDPLGKAKTLCANGGGGGAKTGLYMVSGSIYSLSRSGCEKLQTMPLGYTRAIPDERAITALGNGWTAEIIIHLLTQALKNVPKTEEIVVLSLYDGIATGRYCLDAMGFVNVRYYAYEIEESAMVVAMDNYRDIVQCGDAFAVREDSWQPPQTRSEWLDSLLEVM